MRRSGPCLTKATPHLQRYRQKSIELDILSGTKVPTPSISAACTVRARFSPTTLASFPPRAATAQSPIDGNEGRTAVSRDTRSSSWRKSPHFHSRVAYLLLYGELPSATRLVDFNNVITHHTMINESLLRFFQELYWQCPPDMAMMVGWSARCRRSTDSMDISDPRHREISAHRLIAKIPTIAAACCKHNVGEPVIST